MIKSFKRRETERIFSLRMSRKLPQLIQKTALRKLCMLDAATDVWDLMVPPSNHLKKLTGSRKGKYSIRINDQWRGCFNWKDGSSYDVEIIDYH